MSIMNAAGSAGIGAETGQAAASGPMRQSSAINFNAALGGWDAPTTAKPTHKVAAAMPNAHLAQPHVLQTMMVIHPQALSQQAGSMAQAVTSSEHHTQDLRPRSSNGILQRITVDRGPATGQTTLDPFVITICTQCAYFLSDQKYLSYSKRSELIDSSDVRQT